MKNNQNKPPGLIRDIYHPENPNDEAPRKISLLLGPERAEQVHHHRGAIFGFVALIVLVLGFYGFRAFFLHDLIAESKLKIYTQLEAAQTALLDFNPEGARKSFLVVSDELRAVASSTGRYGVGQITSFWGRFFAGIRDLPDVFEDLIGISDTAVDLTDDIAFFKSDALGYVLNKRGPELLERFGIFKEKIATLVGHVDDLIERPEQLGEENIVALTDLRSELVQVEEVVASLIDFLGSDTSRDLLVLLQNSSEIRPGGGFIGSYAHLVLNKGSLDDIKVVDIYDPDGQLDLRLIPPEPLQRITKDWEARDGNWFFDFPSSARQVMDLLNSSKIYQEQGLTFDSAVAVNVLVFEDVLRLVEPIDLVDYNLSLTAENFLTEVQREVEVGPDKLKNEPKKILQVLAPIIINRLANLQDSDKLTLRDILAHHIGVRNIMAYVNKPVLESYFSKIGLAGEVMELDQDGATDYLAVVNANIAGQKTDIFIEQNIELEAEIDSNGFVKNKLAVSREHTGGDMSEWWYDSANKNYMQIYTSVGTNVLKASGQSSWPSPIVWDYSNYEYDSDVAKIEETKTFLRKFSLDTFLAHNREVFAFWFNVGVGKKRVFNMTYESPVKVDVEDGSTFRFVFERQSGVPTSFDYKIIAPEGYYWEQPGESIFTYESDDPPGRLILELTLYQER